VTDRVIDGEVARGATCIEDLVARCGAGAECGGCWPALEELLHRAATHELVDVRR
jgi:bacterioferritin-associated ferredoxin